MAETKHTGIRCIIVTPVSTILDTRARSVSLPLFDGQRGVARGHAPFIGRLGAGEVRIVPEQGVERGTQVFFAEGGFVEVGHDAVTIITQRAIPGDKLSATDAKAELERLRSAPAVGDEAIEERMKAEEVARALVRAAANSR